MSFTSVTLMAYNNQKALLLFVLIVNSKRKIVLDKNSDLDSVNDI